VIPLCHSDQILRSLQISLDFHTPLVVDIVITFLLHYFCLAGSRQLKNHTTFMLNVIDINCSESLYFVFIVSMRIFEKTKS
jgi:hypothetical protein